jgi:hypothetical protein
MSAGPSVEDLDLALRVLNVHRARNSTSPDECAACHRIEDVLRAAYTRVAEPVGYWWRLRLHFDSRRRS